MPSIKSLAWATDLHFEFCSVLEIVYLAQHLESHRAEAVLITGDIANARGLAQALGILARTTHKPIYFTGGNHDRYGGDFKSVELIIKEASQLFPNLIRLTGAEIIPLSERTALIGVDGWACGTSGHGRHTTVRLNDDTQIGDLKILPADEDRFDFMFAKAKAYTEVLQPTLQAALEQFETVLVGTHVPPFAEACWHEGKISGPDFLPFFSSPVMGRMIRGVAANHSTKTIQIYTGHTHSSGFFESGNIKCWTGSARYGYPAIQAVIEVA